MSEAANVTNERSCIGLKDVCCLGFLSPPNRGQSNKATQNEVRRSTRGCLISFILSSHPRTRMPSHTCRARKSCHICLLDLIKLRPDDLAVALLSQSLQRLLLLSSHRNVDGNIFLQTILCNSVAGVLAFLFRSPGLSRFRTVLLYMIQSVTLVVRPSIKFFLKDGKDSSSNQTSVFEQLFAPYYDLKGRSTNSD